MSKWYSIDGEGNIIDQGGTPAPVLSNEFLLKIKMDKIKQIIETAIPLTDNCDIKRSAEIKRRAKLRIDIEAALRNAEDMAKESVHRLYRSQPFSPKLEYKSNHPS